MYNVILMADIIYEPIKKIVVHEVEKLSLDQLILARSEPGRPIRIFWCDGIAFFIFYSMDARYAEEQMREGTIICRHIFYAEVPRYEPIVSMNDDKFGNMGSVKAYFEEVGWSKRYREIVAWIKEWENKYYGK